MILIKKLKIGQDIIDINCHEYATIPKTVYKLHMHCEDIKVK